MIYWFERQKMIKHIILWKLNDSFQAEERDRIISDIKNGLEGLKGRINGLNDIRVITGRETSTADLMLDSTFTDMNSYIAYKTNPEHVYVADTFVRPNVSVRLCMDYEVLQ